METGDGGGTVTGASVSDLPIASQQSSLGNNKMQQNAFKFLEQP